MPDNNNIPEELKKSFNEAEIRSTPGEFDRFIKSKMWFDLRTTIEERIEFLREKLVALPDTSESTYEMIAIKNQMKAWTEITGLPSYLKTLAHKQGNNKEE